MKSKRQIGTQFEKKAEKILISKGYRILDRNVTYPWGEIDLVAYDASRKELVFVEVRYRQKGGMVFAEESVGRAKRTRIKKAVWTWLLSNHAKKIGLGIAVGFRMDLIAFEGEKARHHENFFFE